MPWLTGRLQCGPASIRCDTMLAKSRVLPWRAVNAIVTSTMFAQRKTWPGASFALLSALLFGVSAPLAKILLGDISPWLLAGLLYLGSGIGLALARPFLPRDEAKLQPADLPWLGAAILAGGVIGPVLLMFGLAQGAAGATSLLLNLESVLTLLLAWIVFRESVDRRLLVGAAAI